MQLGKRIKELRIENNLTQEALAEQLGVSFQAVSRWENGDTNCDQDDHTADHKQHHQMLSLQMDVLHTCKISGREYTVHKVFGKQTADCGCTDYRKDKENDALGHGLHQQISFGETKADQHRHFFCSGSCPHTKKQRNDNNGGNNDQGKHQCCNADYLLQWCLHLPI